MSDLQLQFQQAVEQVQNSDSSQPMGNDVKLEMYGLFKQASAGDVTGDKPGMMDFIKLAKYMAWETNKGLSQEDAMKKYIQRVTELTAI